MNPGREDQMNQLRQDRVNQMSPLKNRQFNQECIEVKSQHNIQYGGTKNRTVYTLR